MHPHSKPLPLTGSRYITYPHCNGFRTSGNRVLINEAHPDHTLVIEFDLDRGTERPLLRIDDHLEYLWFDLPLEGDSLFYTTQTSLVMVDLDRSPMVRHELMRVGEGTHTHVLPSVSADGSTALLAYMDGNAHGFRLLDARNGTVLGQAQWNWFANHFHLSPFDPSWIGLCHEGPTETINDRIYAWHAQEAPEARCIFDQKPDSHGNRLCVGHERWCFHERAALAIAYGVSPHGPRGVWKLSPYHEPRLISEANRDWHCNVSRDGRFAVVDTTGPFDAPGCGWEGHGGVSDILLIDMQSGERRFVARSHLGAKQHCHPHPAFSPDGRWIVFNECLERSDLGELSRVRCVQI